MKTKLLLTLALICAPLFADTGWLFTPLYTQGTNNPTSTATCGHVGSLYFNTSTTPSTVYIKTDDYCTTNWTLVTASNGAYAPLASPTFTGTATAPTYNESTATASTAAVFDSSKNLGSSSTTATELGYVHGVTSALQTQLNLLAPLASPALTGTPTVNGGAANQIPFVQTCTITSAAAATVVHCLPAANVGAGQKAYVTGFHGYVNGATAWATTATCSLQDTAGSPVNLLTVAVAAMTGNAYVVGNTSGVTLSTNWLLGTGLSTAKGVDLVCNATGTGSDFVVTIDGVLK